MRAVSDRGERGENKATPFECGFNIIETGRIPFSIQFFLVALVFLIFDVEIVLLFPFALSERTGGQRELFCFLVILTAGLFYE
jgi:NADH:ubiquinone oxidoreductase subunit 3 (subunit A)